MAEKHQCSGDVFRANNGMVRGWGERGRCTRNGKIERDGKWYCGVHDPFAVKARDDASMAKFKAKMDNAARERAKAELAQRALQAMILYSATRHEALIGEINAANALLHKAREIAAEYAALEAK